MVYIADLKDKSKVLTYKLSLTNISSLHGRMNAADRV